MKSNLSSRNSELAEPRFSVIIPLYNKEAEIERTLLSVLAQTLTPMEIVVVDDGSTDRSARIVEELISEGAGRAEIILVRQKNAGETAARNRAMAEARGEYFALIDADDEWKPDFLAEIAHLIDEFPDCGLYSTGFDIVNTDGVFPARTIAERGVVEDFFRDSLSRYISIPSASVIPRWVFREIGGFPEGMRLGGDQYMWVKIARRFAVCFSPARLVRYYMAASNRSAAIYKPEQTEFSFEDFLGSEDFWLREFVARVALGKALTIAAKGCRDAGGLDSPRRAERIFAYTRHSRRLWLRLWALDRLPRRLRPHAHALYTILAWRLLRRGL